MLSPEKFRGGLYNFSKNGYNTMVIICALMRNAWDALSRSEPETGASPDGSIHRESPRSSEPNADGWSVGLAGSARYSNKSSGCGSPRQFGWYREAPSSQRDEGEFYFGGVQHV